MIRTGWQMLTKHSRTSGSNLIKKILSPQNDVLRAFFVISLTCRELSQGSNFLFRYQIRSLSFCMEYSSDSLYQHNDFRFRGVKLELLQNKINIISIFYL